MAESKVEGGRFRNLQKEREKQLKAMEERKEQIRKDNQVVKMDSKFAQTIDKVEEEFKLQTVGLKSREEYAATRAELEKEKRVADALAAQEKDAAAASSAAVVAERKRARAKASAAKLSFQFNNDDDDDDDSDSDSDSGSSDEESTKESKTKKSASVAEPVLKKVKLSKNPHVDTSFLPDRDREEKEEKLRRELAEKWLQEQEQVKQEPLEITYSYWDGTGHRGTVRVKKGDSIARFLQTVQKDWKELRTVSVENLIYVKEDLLIPHHYTFYDLIVTKARGKSGPLFRFDARDDIRSVTDTRIEVENSHPGKVCERRWYESNKHIFPASQWSVYDPKIDYGKYKIK